MEIARGNNLAATIYSQKGERMIPEVSKVIFIYYGSEEEFSSKKKGSDRIQYELAKKYSNKVVPIASFSSVFKLLDNFISKSKKEKGKRGLQKTFISKYRWTLINIVWIFQHYLLHSLFLKRSVIKELNNYDIVVLGTILGTPFIKKVIKSKLIILDHNVSWLFTYYNIERVPIIWRILVALIKKIEVDAINAADEVWALSKHDAKILKKYAENPEKIKVVSARDILDQYDKKEVESAIERSKKLELYYKLKGKFVIGFIGSYFKPNIIAVENIIRIAKEVPENVVFLVIGSVSKAFENRMNIPPNVIFTGYVDDLDAHLALCDVFINPKTTSDTGMEIKMFDYLKFNKPIISTEMGARGFEDFKNVVIVPIEKMAEVIKKLYKFSDHDTK